MIDVLTNCPLFSGLNEAEVASLVEGLNFQFRTFQKGEVIAFAGEECNHLIILLTGSIHGEMLDYSGKILKIEDIHAPAPLASAFIFGRENKFPVNVIANEQARVMIIGKEELIKLLAASPAIMKNFLDNISTRAQFLTSKLKMLSFRTIKGKIANYILGIAGNKLELVYLDKTQHHIADLFGVTRPSLARALGEMSRDGIIGMENKAIRILNRERLEELTR
jgi:CRP-like cAMP-binding protein